MNTCCFWHIEAVHYAITPLQNTFQFVQYIVIGLKKETVY